MAAFYTLLLFVALFGASVPVIESTATLEMISSIYLPFDYQKDGDPEYGIDVGAVEQGVMDTTTMFYYGAGMLVLMKSKLYSTRGRQLL